MAIESGEHHDTRIRRRPLHTALQAEAARSHRAERQAEQGKDFNVIYPNDPLESRYQRDPAFHQLVDMLHMFIAHHQFSPSELREALVFAATKYELENLRPVVLTREQFADDDAFERAIQYIREQRAKLGT